MNIAMEQTEVSSEQMGRLSMSAWNIDVTHSGLQEYVNGQLKNKYGDAFIRGNNGERPAALCMLLTGLPSSTGSETRCAAVLYISTVKS